MEQREHKRNNMIWIKMINYEIIHSSFMLRALLKSWTFPNIFLFFCSSRRKTSPQLKRAVSYIHQLWVSQTSRVVFRCKVFLEYQFEFFPLFKLLSMSGESLCNYPFAAALCWLHQEQTVDFHFKHCIDFETFWRQTREKMIKRKSSIIR